MSVQIAARRSVARVAGLVWPVAVALIAVPAQARDTDPAVSLRVEENASDRIVLQYELGEFGTEPIVIDGQKHTRIVLGTESPIKIAGAPELPNVCRAIIIPDDAEMALKVLAAEYYDIDDLLVAPSKGVLPRTVNPDDVLYTFGDVYETDAFYPGELATLREPHIQRDFRGVVVELNPFRYNPVTRTLRVYTQVTLEVVAVGPGKINVLRRRPPELSLSFHQIYSYRFVNYEPDPWYTPLAETGDMLIIAHDPWIPNVQPLADHKNAQGINTTLVGVSTIGNNATAIKNYIQNVYNTSDLAFVLLVGDSAQVATPYASGGAADPTYSLLAGGDNYPDIMVGRFSAENTAQVDTQVLRTIEYELMPAAEQPWFKRGTGIGSAEGSGIGDDGESDREHIENIRTDLLAYGYTQVDQIYDPGATAGQVTNALNAGRGILNYCGHGSRTAWGTTGFSIHDVDRLTNDNMLPFIVDVACVNGEFNGTTCFAEAWMRATNGSEPTGAIGIYASSVNQYWAPPMCAQDESVDLLVAETYFSFGALCFAGSCQMMDEYGMAGVDMFHTWHVFGDPSVCVSIPPALTIRLVDPVPKAVEPGVPLALRVQIQDGTEIYLPGSGLLHYRFAGSGPFQTSPLTPLGGDLYLATLPAAGCDDTPQFYFSAEGDAGTVVYEPRNAPDDYYTTPVGIFLTIMEDTFETNQGWVAENLGATSGDWERGVPVNDPNWDYDPQSDGDGSGQCYVTENRAGNTDVDNGAVRLTSPAIDMSPGNITISYLYFLRLTNTSGGVDRILVEINSNNGAGPWIEIARHDSDGGLSWRMHEITQADLDAAGVVLTDTMKLRFTTNDADPQSINESGLDGFLVSSFQCEEVGETILPDDYTIVRGQHVSGGLTDLFESDDSYLLLWPNLFLTPTEPPVWVIVEGTATTASPAGLSFTLEAYATTTGLVQKIELFNYVTQSYEELDSRNTTLSDSVVEVVVTGDPSRFIEPGTLAMQAQLTWRFGPVGIYAFDVGIDRTIWLVTP